MVERERQRNDWILVEKGTDLVEHEMIYPKVLVHLVQEEKN